MSKLQSLLLGLASASLFIGCSPEPTAQPATVLKSQVEAKVERIVFVDKADACECTQTRVEKTRQSLKLALVDQPELPIEVLHIDTQTDKVAPYRAQTPLMALPAVYMIDAQNKVVALLQGEVTQAQFAEAIHSKAQ